MIPAHGAYVQEYRFLGGSYASRARACSWTAKRRIEKANRDKLIRRIVDCQLGICPACDGLLKFHRDLDISHPLRPSIDHVFPRSKGGGNYGNFLVMHGECNHAKADRLPTGCEMIWLAAVNARLGVLE